jgi:hypothetical protein
MLVRLHLRVGVRNDRVARVTYSPIYVRHPDYTVRRAARGSESWRRTVAVVGSRRLVRPER